jgi:hypothetical protein
MSRPQPSLTIDVDVTNPGQFFACCGLLELAHRLLQGDAIEGWFDEGMFCIAAAGSAPDAFYRVFEGLLSTQIEEINARGDRTTHPVRLAAFGITLDWWIDDRGKKRLSSSGRASRHHLGLSTTCVMHYMGFLRSSPRICSMQGGR